ncbi:MAG: hypothetical protein ACLP8X_37055 [Streptosporangiaceae bacterium]
MKAQSRMDSIRWAPGVVITSNQASTTSRVAVAADAVDRYRDRRSAKYAVAASPPSRITSNPAQAMS